MPETFVLGRQAVRQVQRLVREEMMTARSQVRPRTEFAQPGLAVYIAKTGASTIAGLSGTTPGSGTVTVQEVNSAGDLQALTDSLGRDVTITAYNLSSAAVPANSYIQIKQECASGTLCIENVAQFKQLIRFSLDEVMAKTDSSADASIEDQIGPGAEHADVTITVNNPTDATNGDYTYAGAEGATGWAIWDTGTQFWIIDMDCEAA